MTFVRGITAGVAVLFLAACGGSSSTTGDGGAATDGAAGGDQSAMADGAGPAADGKAPTSDGQAPTSDSGGPRADGGGTKADGGGTNADAGACLPGKTATKSSHKAGQDCLSCHKSQPASRRWTIAGNLYNDANGTKPVGGATIRIVDAAKKQLDLVTAADGSFHTLTAVTFPITILASKCPEISTMKQAANDGSCNSCHTAGKRMHLP